MASRRLSTDDFVERVVSYGSLAIGLAVLLTLIPIWLACNTPRVLSRGFNRAIRAVQRHPRLAIRWILTGLAAASLIWIFLIGLPLIATYRDLRGSKVTFADLRFNDVTKAALDMKLDQAKSQFAYSLLLFGVLWGFVAVSKDRPRVSAADIPELMLLIIATTVLIANAASFVYYMNTLSRLTATAGRHGDPKSLSMPDFLDPRIEALARFQRYSLLVAAVMVALLVISVHRLKGEQSHAEPAT